VLGMLGGGGSVLTLPMLLFAFNLEPRAAIASSLFVVGCTSIVTTFWHARKGAVHWRLGVTFGVAAMLGAFGGGYMAHLLPPKALLVALGIVMVVTGSAMLRKRAAVIAEPRPLRLERALALGTLVGLVSGTLGAGGGFLIVPTLTLFGGLTMPAAIGTSLLVIGLQSFAGFAGHIRHVNLDWSMVAVVTSASVVGSMIGALASARISAHNLRHAFAWLVLAVGTVMIARPLLSRSPDKIHFTPPKPERRDPQSHLQVPSTRLAKPRLAQAKGCTSQSFASCRPPTSTASLAT